MSNATKEVLVKAIANRADLTLPKAEEVLRIFTDSISQALKTGDKVTIMGFGSFKTLKRNARQGISPQTLKPINIPAKMIAKFVAGKELTDLVA